MSHALSIALFHSLWQGLAIAALAELASQGTRDPRTRGRVAGAALALQLAAFLLTFVAHLPLRVAPLRVVVAAPSLPVGDGPSLWVFAWSLGVLALSVRWVVGLLGVQALRARSIPAPPALVARFDELRRQLGLSRRVALRLVRDIGRASALAASSSTRVVPVVAMRRRNWAPN